VLEVIQEVIQGESKDEVSPSLVLSVSLVNPLCSDWYAGGAAAVERRGRILLIQLNTFAFAFAD